MPQERTPEGKKELVGLTDGVRESTRSWKELLLDLKRRGLSMGPELAVADRLNIDLANVFAAWTDTISSVKRPALGIECTVRSFGTLEALRSFSYLSCHSKVISLPFYDQRVPSWSELKLGVLRTQQ